MLMKGKQLTTQPSEQSCSLGINPGVTWHINLSSAHAHHCWFKKKKKQTNDSVLVRSTASGLIPHTRGHSMKTAGQRGARGRKDVPTSKQL